MLLQRWMLLLQTKSLEILLNTLRQLKKQELNLNKKFKDGNLKQEKSIRDINKHSSMILKTSITMHQDQATQEALISPTPTK